MPRKSGFGKDAVSWPMTDRPSRCRIRRRTSRLIRNLRNRSQALAFHWRALRLSFRSPAERCLTWESAAMQARDTANWECFASCGTSCVPEMSCSPIATCVPGTKSFCSNNAESTRSLASIIAVEPTSGAANAWAKAITSSSGPDPTFVRSSWQDSEALPDFLTVRETRVQVQQPGFRSRKHHRRHDVAGRGGDHCQ